MRRILACVAIPRESMQNSGTHGSRPCFEGGMIPRAPFMIRHAHPIARALPWDAVAVNRWMPPPRCASRDDSPLTLGEGYNFIPHNPLLAGPLHRMGLIAQAGIDTPNRIGRCKGAGLRRPGFGHESRYFLKLWWRPASEAAGKPTANVVPQVHTQVTLQAKGLNLRASETSRRHLPIKAAHLTAQAALFCQEPTSERDLTERIRRYRRKTLQPNAPSPYEGRTFGNAPSRPTPRQAQIRTPLPRVARMDGQPV